MISIDQLNQCPNCSAESSLMLMASDYGYVSKILGAVMKSTDLFTCADCNALITEVWVLSRRDFTIPDPPDEGERMIIAA